MEFRDCNSKKDLNHLYLHCPNNSISNQLCAPVITAQRVMLIISISLCSLFLSILGSFISEKCSDIVVLGRNFKVTKRV